MVARRIAGLLLLVLAMNGCASVIVTLDRPTIYGGVRGDVSWPGVEEKFGGPPNWLVFALQMIDLPFSFALDTILLPLTVPFELLRE